VITAIQRWVNFARDGDPNGKAGSAAQMNPFWPKYRKDEDRHLKFADRIRVEEGLDREACDLLDQVAARSLPESARPMSR
jgi:carboxylesterase type B